MKKVLLLIITSMSAILYTEAQSFPDMALNKNFAAQVKSLDEFIQRFNGSESHPELIGKGRALNLVALFDYDMDHDGLSDSLFKKKISDFIQYVEESNSVIALTDAGFYAEIKTTTLLSGKKVPLSLILQSQTYNEDRVRWAIVGVRGLKEANILDLKHFYGISPVDHETHFMSIGDIFAHNTQEIMGYRGKDTKIDELSVLLTMTLMGQVRIESVDNMSMHCLEIPGYVFTITEKGCQGQNSGWLISSINKIYENDKINYLTKLLGI